MRLVHIQPVYAQLLKGHNVVLSGAVLELFELGFKAALGALQRLNGEPLRPLAFQLPQTFLHLEDLLRQKPLLPLYNGSLQQGELAVGQYAEVIYDGKMTHSIPAQIAALAINVYPLTGTVDAVEEDGRVLVTPADGGEQVVLSLPDGVTMEAGETATFYTNGMATLSIPAQMNAIGVVK